MREDEVVYRKIANLVSVTPDLAEGESTAPKKVKKVISFDVIYSKFIDLVGFPESYQGPNGAAKYNNYRSNRPTYIKTVAMWLQPFGAGFEHQQACKIADIVSSIWEDKEYLLGRSKTDKKSYERYLSRYSNRVARKKGQLEKLGVNIS